MDKNNDGDHGKDYDKSSSIEQILKCDHESFKKEIVDIPFTESVYRILRKQKKVKVYSSDITTDSLPIN